MLSMQRVLRSLVVLPVCSSLFRSGSNPESRVVYSGRPDSYVPSTSPDEGSYDVRWLMIPWNVKSYLPQHADYNWDHDRTIVERWYRLLRRIEWGLMHEAFLYAVCGWSMRRVWWKIDRGKGRRRQRAWWVWRGSKKWQINGQRMAIGAPMIQRHVFDTLRYFDSFRFLPDSMFLSIF